MSRIGMPGGHDLSPEQAEVVSEVVAGRRGKVPAPMIAWLRNPELARRGQRLGELLRFETTLEPALSELAILVCGRHWTSHHEWSAHKKIGLEAGLSPAVVADIAARRRPPFETERAALVFDLAETLLTTGRLDDELYRRGLGEFSERGMVELVSLVGYYSLVALTLNAFEIGLPERFAPELQDTRDPRQ